MLETEIRFAVPRDLDSTVERFLFSAASGGTEFNRTTYFDTPDSLLWRNGIECRVTATGAGFRQTVKNRVAGGSAFWRNEQEICIDVEQPYLPMLQAAVANDIAGRLAPGSIHPRFRVEINRRRKVVGGGEFPVEANHDVGCIIDGDRAIEFDEVEVKSRRGASGFTETCLDFLDGAPCGLQTEGRAARGFRLLTGEPPAPVHAEFVHVPPETPTPEAISMILRGAFAQALANQAALIRTGHPESIHQMRVGLRRLRSVLSAFAPVLALSETDGLIAATKTLFARLGEIREADVFATETIETIPDALIAGRARDTLLREVRRYRDGTYADVIETIGGPEFARFAVRWHQWIEGERWLRDGNPVDRLMIRRPISQFAEGRLDEMRGKLLRRGRRASRGTLEDWHRLRLAAKKLRYAGEPLLLVQHAEPDGGGKARLTKSMARLQDDLGQFNDMCNVAPFLRRVAEKVPPRSRHGFDEAAAFCTGWSHAEASHAVDRLARTWKKFESVHGSAF